MDRKPFGKLKVSLNLDGILSGEGVWFGCPNRYAGAQGRAKTFLFSSDINKNIGLICSLIHA